MRANSNLHVRIIQYFLQTTVTESVNVAESLASIVSYCTVHKSTADDILSGEYTTISVVESKQTDILLSSSCHVEFSSIVGSYHR